MQSELFHDIPTKKQYFEGLEIRALSFWQPFAGAMLWDKVETRKWNTNFRGLVLICATKKVTNGLVYYDLVDRIDHEQLRHMNAVERVNLPEFKPAIIKEFEDPNRHKTSFEITGHAIGVGQLVDCDPIGPGMKTYVGKAHERGEKLFAHVYTNVRRIKPFPVTGSQGWFNVTNEMKSQIKFL